MGTRQARVSKWLGRFALQRMAGLNDSARSAEKRRKYTSVTEKRILKALDEPAPAGYSRWNGRLLAEHLGNVSKDQVWRVMRKHDLHLERRQSWCVSTDPEFSRKAADVVGLYLNPPQNALVLCVDEKPCIQALERAQGSHPLAQWARTDRLCSRIQASRHHHALCSSGGGYGPGAFRTLSSPAQA